MKPSDLRTQRASVVGVCQWTYWHECHSTAEAYLWQLKQDAEDELLFLEKLQTILNKYHSMIPVVEIGRQNVLNDVDNELQLDKRIQELKEVLKDEQAWRD